MANGNIKPSPDYLPVLTIMASLGRFILHTDVYPFFSKDPSNSWVLGISSWNFHWKICIVLNKMLLTFWWLRTIPHSFLWLMLQLYPHYTEPKWEATCILFWILAKGKYSSIKKVSYRIIILCKRWHYLISKNIFNWTLTRNLFNLYSVGKMKSQFAKWKIVCDQAIVEIYFIVKVCTIMLLTTFSRIDFRFEGRPSWFFMHAIQANLCIL